MLILYIIIALRQAQPFFLPIEDKWYGADNLEIGNRQFIVLDHDGYMPLFVQEFGAP